MSQFAALVIVLAPSFNSEGVVAWGVKNIIPIILLVVGIGIIASARKGQMSQNAMTITNVTVISTSMPIHPSTAEVGRPTGRAPAVTCEKPKQAGLTQGELWNP